MNTPITELECTGCGAILAPGDLLCRSCGYSRDVVPTSVSRKAGSHATPPRAKYVRLGWALAVGTASICALAVYHRDHERSHLVSARFAVSPTDQGNAAIAAQSGRTGQSASKSPGGSGKAESTTDTKRITFTQVDLVPDRSRLAADPADTAVTIQANQKGAVSNKTGVNVSTENTEDPTQQTDQKNDTHYGLDQQ